ncbi:hypothetical protein ACSBR2_040692 [Camellia fascicularis]
MENEKQIEQSLEEQDQISKEENHDNQDEIKKEEDKVIHMIEANQLQGDVKEQRQENEAGKVGKSQTDSIKKLKQGSKQNIKAKGTIPQPFCLATEKRMSRERRGSMDFKEYKPTLSRSGSLNYKALSQSSVGAERTSNQRHAKSINTAPRSSLPPKIAASEPVDKRVENGPKSKNKTQGKETEKKKPQLDANKQEGGEVEGKKIQKSSTFKALPLPSFYQQQKGQPPRPETKKITASHTKSPLLGQESKSVNKSGDSKGKLVAIGKTISRRAKETISKLHKTTPKSLSTLPNEVVKAVVSSG